MKPRLSLSAIFLVLCVPYAVQAKTVFPGGGSSGDASIREECPDNQYLVGFEGRAGSWIDQIVIICAPVGADGKVAKAAYQSPPRGGMTGGTVRVECSRGSAIKSMNFYYTSGRRQVSGFNYTCDPGRSGGTFDGGDSRNRPSSGFPIAPSSDLGSTYDREQRCADDEVGTGLSISYGRHVNSLALICDTLERRAVASSATPAKAPLSTVPVLATDLGFAGSWDTRTNQDGAFVLILRILNPHQFRLADLNVTGEFIAAGQPQYNGTLTGKIRPGSRRLEYTYVQPGISGAGTGTFVLSQDGKTFSGNGVHAGKDKFTWNGTRK